MTSQKHPDETLPSTNDARGRIQKVKSSNWSTWLIAVSVLLAWLTTLFAAASDCTLPELLNIECTNINYPIKSTSPKIPAAEGISKSSSPKAEEKQAKDQTSAAELKGQFGDFFGVLNALFGALTLVTVYRAYRLQIDQVNHSNDNATNQLHAQQFERYLIEVESAIASYNRLVGAVVVPDGKQRWESIHGLFHLWKVCMIYAAQIQSKVYTRNLKNTPAKETSDNSLNLWEPILKQVGLEQYSFSDKILNAEWVLEQIHALDDEHRDVFQKGIVRNWNRLYNEHRYQLDVVFRSWFYVCRTIETAKTFNVDAETEWRIASRFRAQLSNIELQFLLFRLTLSKQSEFPQSIEMAERYAMFDNYIAGVDPIAITVLLNARQVDGKINPTGFDSTLAKQQLRSPTNT